LATIEKRGNSYRIMASCGYDVDGTQEKRRMTWKPEPGMTERQIQKELQRQAVLFEEECRRGYVIQKSLKFEEFAKQYFEDYADQNLRVRTATEYHRMEKKTYKAIGHLKMDKITPLEVQKFIRSLVKGDTKTKPVSPKTAKNYLAFVSSVFTYAVQMRVVKENPCHAVKVALGEREERDCYTLEEAQQFLNLLANEPLFYQAFFTLAIYGGYRRGELCGLEWKDIDFDTCVVSIRRTSLYTKAKGTFTDTTKTKSSKRSLKMPAEVIEILRRYRVEQNTHRLKVGDQWVNTDRLFTYWNGKAINPNSPYKWLCRFCERTGMRRAKSALHSFRHLNASLLITNGVDVKTVSTALGHTQVSTTTNIYAHTFAKVQADASDAIAAALPLKSRA